MPTLNLDRRPSVTDPSRLINPDRLSPAARAWHDEFEQDGKHYRRLVAWLRHALKSGVDADRLQSEFVDFATSSMALAFDGMTPLWRDRLRAWHADLVTIAAEDLAPPELRLVHH